MQLSIMLTANESELLMSKEFRDKLADDPLSDQIAVGISTSEQSLIRTKLNSADKIASALQQLGTPEAQALAIKILKQP
jgi:hypothetical protein